MIDTKPQEEHIFNRNNAYYLYRRGIGDIEKNVLPSTSPTYAAMRLSEKLPVSSITVFHFAEVDNIICSLNNQNILS